MRERRRDVEGLRAIAILSVVAFHAGLPGLSGGYVGVDVFFVISGYLITDHLWRELATTGRIDFTAFYARRARRLLPCSLVVVVATVAVAATVLPPLERGQIGWDGLASGLYVANYRFAAEATNYLSNAQPSPLLHYWSLGVEEQFYLLWPLLLLAGAWLAGRRSRRAATRAPARRHARRRGGVARPEPHALLPAAVAALAVVAVASFVVSLWLTRVDEPVAFFSLPTRAWELAIGGLVALGAPAIRRLADRPGALLGWLGLGAIAWSLHELGSTTPFPGVAALAPVLGTAAVIASGSASADRSPRFLRIGPMQLLGGVSYTWYLWHWPALVLAPAALGRPMDGLDRLGVVAGSLVLAFFTSALIERPLRRSPWLAAHGDLDLLAAGALSCVVAAVSLVAVGAVPLGPTRSLDRRVALVALRRATLPSDRAPALSGGPAAEAKAETEAVERDVSSSLAGIEVPDDLDPPLSVVASGYGMAAPFFDGCFDGFTDTEVHPCDYGDVGSPTTVVLFGDSHALMWFPALDPIADRQRWHLVAQAKATCPPLDIEVFSPDLDEWYTQCDIWREAVLARIHELRPAVVVLGFSREYGWRNDHVRVDRPAWMRGLSEMIATLEADGSRVVVMGDVPYPSGSVPDCLSAHPDDLSACEIPRRRPFVDLAGIAAERRVVTAAGAAYVDTEPWFCGARRCAVVVGDKVVYHDDNHLAAGYAAFLEPALAAALRSVTPSTLWSS